MALSSNNILLCAGDYALTATFYAQGDLGTVGYPLTNLLLPELYLPAQFSTRDPASTWFTLDLGKVRLINIAALLKHNLTYVGKWRIRIYDADPGSNSPIYDSATLTVFPVISGFGGLSWGEFYWGGSLSEFAEISQGFNRHSMSPFDTVYGRYVRIDIDDGSNPNLPQIGRFWTSKGYQPTFNAIYGSGITTVDETEVSKSRSGVRHYGRVTKRKAGTFIFEMLPRKELLFQIFGPIFQQTGKAEEILVMLNPQDPETWFYESIFGNLTDMDRSDYSSYERMNTTLSVEEAV